MQPIIQFENTQERIYADVFSQPDQNLIVESWLDQSVHSEEIIQVIDHGLASIARNDIECYLCDISRLPSMSIKGVSIAIEYLRAHLIPGPLRKLAFVSQQKTNTGRELLIESIQSMGIEVDLFPDRRVALDWLSIPTMNDDVWERQPELHF